MSRTLIVLLVLSGFALPLDAQTPSPRRAGPAGGPLRDSAEFLLANSARLELTNEQVVRLAEVARGAEARREELRSEMRAARSGQNAQPDSSLREERRSILEQLQESSVSDREAAIAILTDEQQARAWELMARQRPQRPRAGAVSRPRARGQARVRPDRALRGQQPSNPSAPQQ